MLGWRPFVDGQVVDPAAHLQMTFVSETGDDRISSETEHEIAILNFQMKTTLNNSRNIHKTREHRAKFSSLALLLAAFKSGSG